MTNTACNFTTDNGNGIRFVCVSDHRTVNPKEHLMKRADLYLIDPDHADEGTDEWTGAFWYAVSCGLILTAFIGLLMAVWILYLTGQFQ